MCLHMNFQLSFFFKSHSALIALTARFCATVFLFVNIPSMLICELAITHFAVVLSIAQGVVNYPQMNQKTSPQLEDLSANVANEPMVIVHHLQVIDIIFVHSKG